MSRDRKAYFRKRYADTSRWLNSLRTKCRVCSEDDPVVLDFHHRNPKQKKFPLTAKACYFRKKEQVLEEIAECDILCANCHRKEEYRLRKLPRSSSV